MKTTDHVEERKTEKKMKKASKLPRLSFLKFPTIYQIRKVQPGEIHHFSPTKKTKIKNRYKRERKSKYIKKKKKHVKQNKSKNPLEKKNLLTLLF